MALEAKSGGVAAAVRRPLQPRDGNAASLLVAAAAGGLSGKAFPKAKTKARARLAAAALPPSVKSYPWAESRVVTKEVSLAEELEKARERRGRLRAAREVTERVLEERDEAWEWDRRADEQRRVVSELMRLLGMPEIAEIKGGEEEKTGDRLYGFSGFGLDSFNNAGRSWSKFLR